MERIGVVAVLAVAVHLSFSISVIEKLAFRTCIRERRENAEITKNDTRFCRIFAREEAYSKTNFKSPEAQKSEARNVAFKYFQNLVNWKNGQNSLESSLLDRVASCWKVHASVKSKWEFVYSKRRYHEVHHLEVLSQTWRDDEGFATISPFLPSMDADSLEAAEILLQRHVSSEIGETYGRYRTLAYFKQNKTWEKLHSDYQPSCSSNRGDMMVLELNVASLRIALASGVREPLRFRIRVQPRRQYFSEPAEDNQRVSVVKQTVGLILHFRHSEEVISSYVLYALRNAKVHSNSAKQDRVDSTNDTSTGVSDARGALMVPRDDLGYNGLPGSRQKRGAHSRRNTRPPPREAALTTGTCRRRPHRMSREVYESLKIKHPEYENEKLDVGDCFGACTYPLETNATTHSVILAMDMPRIQSLTLCCTPVAYSTLNVVVFEGYFRSKPLDNFVAESCACR